MDKNFNDIFLDLKYKTYTSMWLVLLNLVFEFLSLLKTMKAMIIELSKSISTVLKAY